MTVLIAKQIHWIVILATGIFSLLVLFFEILIVSMISIDIINGEFPTGLDWITLVCLSLLLIIILDVILWQIKGYEIVQMEDANFIYQKRGKLFCYTKTIPYFEIENIRVKSLPTTIYNLRCKMLGTRGGKIKIEYLGREFFFGFGLTEEKAQEYVLLMNELLTKYNSTF